MELCLCKFVLKRLSIKSNFKVSFLFVESDKFRNVLRFGSAIFRCVNVYFRWSFKFEVALERLHAAQYIYFFLYKFVSGAKNHMGLSLLFFVAEADNVACTFQHFS